MHSLSTSFILGYHGCTRQTGEKLLLNEPFVSSENDFDWLGSGVYFWEANPDRALTWARERVLAKATDQLQEPFVVGAVIDPGFCLDLISSNGLQAVETAYSDLRGVISASGRRLPENASGEDLTRRSLDCAVINYLHRSRRNSGQAAFDCVRGVFLEGERIYRNSGFRRKTHIQMCVRNPDAIKGVFRVPEKQFSTSV